MPLYYYSMWRLRQGLNTEQTDTQTNKEKRGGFILVSFSMPSLRWEGPVYLGVESRIYSFHLKLGRESFEIFKLEEQTCYRRADQPWQTQESWNVCVGVSVCECACVCVWETRCNRCCLDPTSTVHLKRFQTRGIKNWGNKRLPCLGPEKQQKIFLNCNIIWITDNIKCYTKNRTVDSV